MKISVATDENERVRMTAEHGKSGMWELFYIDDERQYAVLGWLGQEDNEEDPQDITCIFAREGLTLERAFGIFSEHYKYDPVIKADAGSLAWAGRKTS